MIIIQNNDYRESRTEARFSSRWLMTTNLNKETAKVETIINDINISKRNSFDEKIAGKKALYNFFFE